MILDVIVEKTKERILQAKQEKSLEQLKKEVAMLPSSKEYIFEKALKEKGMSYILEVKKASPSKGDIIATFDYVNIAKEYENIGASAISVVTEPYFFKGSDRYLQEISKAVTIPLLRKDFVMDPYMLYEAKLLGASAVLLICRILTEEVLKEYLDIAHQLGLSCLVETHNQEEIEMALRVGARIIGVNNRNLQDFSVDIANSIHLKKYVDKDTIFVSESGITTREDMIDLENNHVNAVLIGETLMKSKNKKKMLDTLKGCI